MSRGSKKLSNTTLKKLEKFSTLLDNEEVYKKFDEVVKRDLRMVKSCTEASIVDFYISEFNSLVSGYDPEEVSYQLYDKKFWDALTERARIKLANKFAPSKIFNNTIDTYFNEVKREYILHPMAESEEMEFIPENKDIFIKNNLKLVINCAKRYRGLGMEFEDLIQIGNVGLMNAYDRFDTNRANLRFAILKDIDADDKQVYTYDEASEIITKNFTYSKLLDTTLKKIPEEGFKSKEEFTEWVNLNIKKASFASISFIWIRSCILTELSRYANVVYIPKKPNEEDGDQQTVNIIRLDSVNPHTDDNYHDNQIAEIANEEFAIEDDRLNEMEKQDLLKGLIDKLLNHLPQQDRRIVKKRFGIGSPYPLGLSEIAESEGLNTNRVKYIINNAMKSIQKNATKDDMDLIQELIG